MNTLTIAFLVICATLAYASATPADVPQKISQELPADTLAAAAEPEGLEAQESRGWGHHRGGRWGGHHGGGWGGHHGGGWGGHHHGGGWGGHHYGGGYGWYGR